MNVDQDSVQRLALEDIFVFQKSCVGFLNLFGNDLIGFMIIFIHSFSACFRKTTRSLAIEQIAFNLICLARPETRFVNAKGKLV